MNKKELVEAIAEKSGLSKVDAEKSIDATIQVISNSLKNGDEVRLVGFGTFSVAKRAAKKGINPQTKETINIPASNSPKFKPGKVLKDSLN